MLSGPLGAACSAFDELVVADTGNNRAVVFSAAGDVVEATVREAHVAGVVVGHRSTVFAQSYDRDTGEHRVLEV